MEVFLNNLPEDLNEQSLKKLLDPHLKDLKIQDWSCDKQRKRKNGTVSFLHPTDGRKFLQRYERLEVPGTRNKTGQTTAKARLKLLNTPVYCMRSRFDIDPFKLKSMEKEAHERRHKSQAPKPTEQHHRHSKIVFSLKTLSCGYYDYAKALGPSGVQKPRLAYSPEMRWQVYQGLAKFLKNHLLVTFDISYPATQSFRIEIPYRTIEGVVTSMNTMTLTLWEPPRFYSVVSQHETELSRLMGGLSLQQRIEKAARTRLTHLPHRDGDHRAILGQALVYRLEVDPTDYAAKIDRLRARDVLTITPYFFPPTSELPYMTDGLSMFKSSLMNASTSLSFEVRFQLQALVSNNYLPPWTVQGLLVRMLKANEDKKVKPLSGAVLKKLLTIQPFPGPDEDSDIFQVDKIWDFLQKQRDAAQRQLDEELIAERARQNLCYVYKAQVTPTNVILSGPEPEAKNRILRRFPNHTEYFIRVTFCDEDGQDIFFNPNISNDAVEKRFTSILDEGLQIADRVYRFLGFSHSSLRGHSAWFMAPFFLDGTFHNNFNVIDALGRFHNIRSPARCAARIGQAFSETPFAVSMKINGIREFSATDVQAQGRVFSDGVGMISNGALLAIHATVPDRKTRATCIQIRYAGSKGMLALNGILRGNQIVLRPSMTKFDSDDKENLEICDTANKPIPFYLNRQLIKIMEDMGVPSQFFFKHQNRELNRLRLITANTSNTVNFLKRQKVADHINFPQMIRKLCTAGIDYKQDRFLCSVVEATVLRELRLLKYRARIPINNGVTLFGVMDEFSYLQEGEVYFTFDDSPFVETQSMELGNCQVFVTRSPALHPGDIQRAVNRIPPEGHPLRSMKNCIVFSSKGERDLPSQLSGGDLDGDIYHIIWDKEAVFTGTTFEPADYPRVEPLDIGRKVVKKDMSDFFVKFMATDQLGSISMKHVILADQKPLGTRDENCVLLAQLASTAVDYSKTGIPADLTLLRRVSKSMNRYRPDFLAPAPPTSILKGQSQICFDEPIDPATKDDEDEDLGPAHYQYYESEKILGRLYRAIDEQKIWHKDVRIPRNPQGIKVWDGLIRHVQQTAREKNVGELDWRKYVSEAWKIRDYYEDAISALSYDYSESAAKPITELEVFTGSIFNKTGVQTRRQRDRSIQLKDEFQRIAVTTSAMIRKRQVTDIAVEDMYDDASAVDTLLLPITNPSITGLQLSLACLLVGCSENKGKDETTSWGRFNNSELYSFRVVAACCLVKELNVILMTH